jgi:predicted transposase YbfD/YdcC
MGAQKKIAQAIRDEQADYVLRIKDNQGQLHQDRQDWFAYADKVNFEQMQHRYAETVNKGHGRIEIRRCCVIDDPLVFDYIRHFDGWTDLNSIVRVQRQRRVADAIQQQTAYYISSLEEADAHTLLSATRFHWAAPNSLHWVLDVIFREDQSRIRLGHAAHNMAILRQMALNVIKKDVSKGSIRTKRYKAALDTAFLEQLLDQF